MSEVKPIRTMNYATVASNKGLKKSGLNNGDCVMVIGEKVLPVRRSDPYLQRVYVLCIRVTKEGFHEVPNNDMGDGDNGFRSWLVDPRNLTLLNDESQEALKKKLEEQYGKHIS